MNKSKGYKNHFLFVKQYSYLLDAIVVVLMKTT